MPAVAIRRSLLAAAVAAAGLASGCAAPGSPAVSAESGARAAAAFERFKALQGTWKGEGAMGDSPMPVEIVYRVTAAGSAVEETIFPGSPHEMVTLYHLDGPRLMLTHYCAAGNQPTMVLAPGGDDARLHFDFHHATNMETPAEGHMHEASFDLSSPDVLRSEWTYYEDGKAGMTAAFELRRAE